MYPIQLQHVVFDILVEYTLLVFKKTHKMLRMLKT